MPADWGCGGGVYIGNRMDRRLLRGAVERDGTKQNAAEQEASSGPVGSAAGALAAENVAVAAAGAAVAVHDRGARSGKCSDVGARGARPARRDAAATCGEQRAARAVQRELHPAALLLEKDREAW